MSDAPIQLAARLHDPVAHSHALTGFLLGAVAGAAVAVGAAVVVGMAAAAAGPVLGAFLAGTAIGGSMIGGIGVASMIAGTAVTVIELGINIAVGGWLTEKGEEIGEALGSKSMQAPSGKIIQGSSNVTINSLPAARVGDEESCDAGKIAQGSATVFINGKPAARVGDKVTCGATIVSGSRNVFIGGGTVSLLPIQSEVPEWARWAAIVIGILPALGGLARATASAFAEVKAVGLARAAQTGVKALGRAMEARGGGARPLGLPAPAVSRYPYAEELPLPRGAKETWDFEAKRPEGLDMDNLSHNDRLARRRLERAGWDADIQKQILDSGSNFGSVKGKAGDNMYGFSSKGYAKGSNSPYWMDEPTYRDMQARHYDSSTGTWNSRAVKDELALPCYNQANSVYRGRLATDQTIVRSTINPAKETVTYVAQDGAKLTNFQRRMSGGGTQIHPKNGSVDGIMEHFEP